MKYSHLKLLQYHLHVLTIQPKWNYFQGLSTATLTEQRYTLSLHAACSSNDKSVYSEQ